MLDEMLSRFGACHEARAWSAGMTLTEAWDRCERGDWMLWLAARVGIEHRLVVLAACGCARTALRFVEPGEDRPRLAIEAAEAWARGGETLARAIASSAYASSAYAAYAADSASYAAYAAYAAASSASSAYAAASSAYAAADAARAEVLAGCGSIVREMITAQMIADAYRGEEG